MTIGKIDELFKKFEPLFFHCLANPSSHECRCGANEEGATHACCCASSMPQEVDAFDAAISCLQMQLGEHEKLSAQEIAQFVNLRAKDVLLSHDISYRVSRGGGYLVSYEPRVLDYPLAVPLDSVEPSHTRRKKKLALGFRVLELLLPRKEREAALGDLEEEFTEIRTERGAWAANRYLLRQIRRSLWPLLRRVFVRLMVRVVVRAFYAMALGAIYWIIEHLTGRRWH